MTLEPSSSYAGSGFIGGVVKSAEVPSVGSSSFDKFGSCKRPFDIITENRACKVSEGFVFIGSSVEVEVDELAIGRTFTGTVYLKVSWDSSGEFDAELTTTAPTGSETTSVSRKLYDFENGKPKVDYRSVPTFVMYN